MRIEVNAPCSLTLGVVRLELAGQVRTALLGITLQHPPVNLAAEPAPALQVTGARADLAYTQAQRVLHSNPDWRPANFEIDLAISNYMGLGSDAMLGLSVARSLALLNRREAGDIPARARDAGLGPEHALEVWGFDQGGVLLVDVAEPGGALLRRHNLAHREEEAWAIVLHLPHRPRDAVSTLEADRRTKLLRAAPHVSLETGRLVDDELWPAMAQDDLTRFARALTGLQALNLEALQQASLWEPPAAETAVVLDVLTQNGSAAVGESLTGLARWGLIRGARPSINLRAALTKHVGIDGGTVMASICATTGATHTLAEQSVPQ